MRLTLKLIFALILCHSAIVGFAGAANKPPAEGGILPDIVLNVPENLDLQTYLGLSGKKTFTIPEIKTEVVIIEIFSMY